MSYQIKLEGDSFRKDGLSFEHVTALLGTLYDLAYGSLNIHLNGSSFRKGRHHAQIERAAQLFLIDFDSDTFSFTTKCDPLAQHLESQKDDWFEPDFLESLSNRTPMGVVVDALEAGIRSSLNPTWLDQPLLEKMDGFRKVFASPKDVLIISNEGSFGNFILTSEDVYQIHELAQRIPAPHYTLVSGRLDLSAHHATRLDLETNTQRVKVRLDSTLVAPDELVNWNTELVTVSGMAHYRADGSILRVDADQVRLARSGDAIFANPYLIESPREQLERHRRAHPQTSESLRELVGAWPIDDDYESILKELA